MKAPRDMARAQPSARPLARLASPVVPALAGEAALRDLSDLNVWDESIRRSQRRREAAERQLNFGPVTGKRLAVPMAMLAAGLMVRDAVSDDGSAGATGIAHADRTAATTAAPAKRAKPATHSSAARHSAPALKAATHAPALPHAKTVNAAPTHPAKRVRPAKTRVGDELVKGDHGAAVAYLQRELGLPSDGVYGRNTLAAVERLQKHRGLAVDGNVGPATWRALRSPAKS